MTQDDGSVSRSSKGGRARAAKLTPEQRSEAARKAVNARWTKARQIIQFSTWTVFSGETATFGFYFDGPRKRSRGTA